jgi:hypothetical protein
MVFDFVPDRVMLKITALGERHHLLTKAACLRAVVAFWVL